MYEKIIEIFYYLIPGGTLLSVILYYYWDNLNYNSFSRYLTEHNNLILFFIIILSISIGLFIEGFSDLIRENVPTDEDTKKIKHYTIRKLFFYNKNSLLDFFGTRAAFFRHFTVVWIITVIIMFFECDLSWNKFLFLAALVCISYKLSIIYTEKNTKTAVDYSEDRYFINFK